jgi:FMN phosphatase YigB (HAD superfamily)
MFYLKENNTELSALVFDLGNVLLAYDPARFMFELGIRQEIIPRLLAVTDKRPEWGEYDRGTLSLDDIIALAVREEPLLRKEITHYLKHRAECFTALTDNVALLYQAKEAGLKVYLLSNCSPNDYDYFLEHFIFLQDLDGAIVSGQHRINKPDPAIYELLLKTYPEIDPAHTLFIDDVAANCEGGARAGLLTLNLPAGGTAADYLTIREN